MIKGFIEVTDNMSSSNEVTKLVQICNIEYVKRCKGGVSSIIFLRNNDEGIQTLETYKEVCALIEKATS